MNVGNLKSLSVDALLELRSRLDAVLSERVVFERRELESRLARLKNFGPLSFESEKGRGRRGKVAPKFRNPRNPTETWSGRGLRPRWMTAALKAGVKMSDMVLPDNDTKPQGKRVKLKSKAEAS